MSVPPDQMQAGYTNWAPYLTMAGGGVQFGADMAQGGFNAALARANAGIAGTQARGELEAGSQQAELYRQHLQQTVGRQAAQIGGSGVTMSGSALRSLATTQQLGAEDIARIQSNAARKAWGFQVTQAGDEMRAGFAQKAGLASGLGALITSGSRAYGQWNG
jgi:hypothetical protein